MSKQHYDTLLAICDEADDIRIVTGTDDGVILDEEILNAIIWVVNNPLELMLFKGYEFSLKLPSEFLEVEDQQEV